MVSSGLAAAIECLTWNICDEGDGILVPRPLYAGFVTDIELKSRARCLPVSFRQNDREYLLPDVFEPASNRQALEMAFKKYSEDGIRIRGVLLSK